jgi:hypothetical protein
MVETALREQAVDEQVIGYAAADELGRWWNVFTEPAGQVIENSDHVASGDERVRHVRADESGPASD